MSNRFIKTIAFTALFTVALAERVFFDLGPNIELVTMGFVLMGHYFGRRDAFLFVLITMAVSDYVIGNSSIFLFTWTGFLIPALFSDKGKDNKYLSTLITGFLSTIFFFVWSNFGVWIQDSWGMYANNFSGLIASYVNAVPFLRNHMISTLVSVPVGVILFESIKKSAIKFSKFAPHSPMQNLSSEQR